MADAPEAARLSVPCGFGEHAPWGQLVQERPPLCSRCWPPNTASSARRPPRLRRRRHVAGGGWLQPLSRNAGVISRSTRRRQTIREDQSGNPSGRPRVAFDLQEA